MRTPPAATAPDMGPKRNDIFYNLEVRERFTRGRIVEEDDKKLRERHGAQP